MTSISIIIPVYNTEAYLQECLDSVLVDNVFTGQVVCVNDGSTDGSLRILEQYKKQYPNIEVYTQPNQGQAAARNVGLDYATGDYVLFLDSDDYYSKGTIAYLDRLANSNPDVDFFYIDCAVMSEGKRFFTLRWKEPVKMALTDYYDYEYEQFKSTPAGCVCGGFYKREFIERNHLRMLAGCRYEDALFVFEVFMCQGICMALHIDQPYYYYRTGREGATTAKYTLSHFIERRTIDHECYKRMMGKNLQTNARKKTVYGICEMNVIEAYLNGFKRDMSKFFNGEDVRIMKLCAVTPCDRKLYKLAVVSPKLLAAYRTDQLPSFFRRLINRFL